MLIIAGVAKRLCEARVGITARLARDCREMSSSSFLHPWDLPRLAHAAVHTSCMTMYSPCVADKVQYLMHIAAWPITTDDLEIACCGCEHTQKQQRLRPATECSDLQQIRRSRLGSPSKLRAGVPFNLRRIASFSAVSSFEYTGGREPNHSDPGDTVVWTRLTGRHGNASFRACKRRSRLQNASTPPPCCATFASSAGNRLDAAQWR